VIRKILEEYRKCTFDFRTIAKADDPLRALFDQWVDYYRMKEALARAIKPKRILEIGVRYGYSAAAMLAGAPRAEYCGIDLDAPAYGGGTDGLEFSRKHLPASASLLREDTQKLTSLPGGFYDLIHVDGQQDEVGTYHDLELASRQSRFLLFDGYFWTRSNFVTANDFVLRHRDLIEYSLVIPGYAGDLLIRFNDRAVERGKRAPETGGSGAIRDLYDRDYFLGSCGGWEFEGGEKLSPLEDARLRALFDLVMMWKPESLLDLGCGRGEICLHAARNGVTTVGVDYARDAVEIARRKAANSPELLPRVTWICDDLNAAQLTGPFDVVVVSDVAEHLSEKEIENMLGRAASLLMPAGKLVLHTFPNSWFYTYDYPRRRRAAAALGAHLPVQPRSRFERDMHINEQNPRVLRRQLRRHFKQVELWFGSPEAPTASLRRKMTHTELAAQRDLFAVASNEPFSLGPIADLFATSKLSAADAGLLAITCDRAKMRGRISEKMAVDVEVTNGSAKNLGSAGSWPTFLSYHWLKNGDRSVAAFEGHRTRLNGIQPADCRRRHWAVVAAPSVPGAYVLQVTLVQEHVMWFNDVNPSCQCELDVVIEA